MKSMKLLEATKNLAKEPTRLSIWFETLKHPKITAKTLMTALNINKTNIYYHLKILEEDNLLETTLLPVPQKPNLQFKQYRVSHAHYEEITQGLFSNLWQEYPKDAQLIELHLMSMLIKRQIRKLDSKTNNEVKNQTPPNPEDPEFLKQANMAKTAFVPIDAVPSIFEKIKEIYMLAEKASQGKKLEELISQSSHSLLLGMLTLD